MRNPCDINRRQPGGFILSHMEQWKSVHYCDLLLVDVARRPIRISPANEEGG